jgi:beta-glucosidase/6-phospho-beta-glucosidase/beta-galactosidase
MRAHRQSIRYAVAVVLTFAVSAAAEFPPGFLWGTAISGFQTEAGRRATNDDPRTDWWAWVHDADNIAAGRVSGDLPEAGPAFWDLFADDARRARRRLKSNTMRFGIEWSRIFETSTAGVDTSGGITPATLEQLDALADDWEVAHYRAVLEAVRAEGMVPFVTLNHFSLPNWIHDPIAARDALAGIDPSGPLPAGFGPA